MKNTIKSILLGAFVISAAAVTQSCSSDGMADGAHTMGQPGNAPKERPSQGGSGQGTIKHSDHAPASKPGSGQ